MGGEGAGDVPGQDRRPGGRAFMADQQHGGPLGIQPLLATPLVQTCCCTEGGGQGARCWGPAHGPTRCATEAGAAVEQAPQGASDPPQGGALQRLELLKVPIALGGLPSGQLLELAAL